jgi:hypothetical protein
VYKTEGQKEYEMLQIATVHSAVKKEQKMRKWGIIMVFAKVMYRNSQVRIVYVTIAAQLIPSGGGSCSAITRGVVT